MATDVTIKRGIVIIGKISSGKSTYSNFLSNLFNYPMASFGTYVKDYCAQNSLSTERENLQNVGEKFVTDDHFTFTKNVINHFLTESKNIVIDGVRNGVVYEDMKVLIQQPVFFYIDACQEIRHKRYLERNKDSDKIIDFVEFRRIDSHPIESEIESLKPLCHLVVNSELDLEKNKTLLIDFLKKVNQT